ncbi:MAG: hypothetical protein KA144_09155 [Xanthomonadaceae bacterium]|nr:hypothetical protein [Xanthomonadaceae bacterium]
MPYIRTLIKPSLSLIAAGVLLTNGCALPHAQLPYTKAEPALYCPGETIQTSYDLGTCTAHSGITCESRTPTVTLTTTSAALPSQTFTAFAGNASFTPSEPQVDVTYTVTPKKTMHPFVTNSGENRINDRDFDPETKKLTLINGEAQITLRHDGICNGRIPMNAPSQIPTAPTVSTRARAQRICNANTVRIMVDIAGPPGGASASGSLAPGECLALPPGTEGGTVSVSGPIPVGVQCLATQTTDRAPELRTQVAYNCVE